ncbi:MAG TPA: GAF domain-containing protein [Chroococcales cyanobacterium]
MCTTGRDKMSDREKSQEELLAELALLRRQVAALKATKSAFDAQNELFRSLITMLQTSTGKLMLRAMLQQILDTSRRLTRAEEGSVFLLDANGVVTESILARGATIRGQKQRLIGEVLDKGLAGWVIRHQQVGLIVDTMQDERWLTLPYQPYTVRSALCVPILKGRVLLGVLTLMHSQPRYFSQTSAHLMQMMADQMALILDNARLYTEQQQSGLNRTQQAERGLHPVNGQPLDESDFSLIGLYIIFGEGNFLYANPRLAEIFGYSFGELVSLDSVLDLVSADNRDFVANQLHECFQGHSKNLFCRFAGQRKDGSQINVEVSGTRTTLYGKVVVVGALRLT